MGELRVSRVREGDIMLVLFGLVSVSVCKYVPGLTPIPIPLEAF